MIWYIYVTRSHHASVSTVCAVMRTGVGLIFISRYLLMPCKPPKTYLEQIKVLVEEHGLAVEDEQRAVVYLQRLNYYHLRGYYIHWMDRDQKTFNDGISFEMVIALHHFDERLKLLLWPLLLGIELQLRTSIAYHLAHKYGPLSYLDETCFLDPVLANESKELILSKIQKSSELFAKHYRQKYNGELPIWGVVELLSFGSLSKVFQNLKQEDKSQLALECYGLDGELVNSYIHSLLCVRNICAHNGRLYNRRLPTPVKISSANQKLIDERVSPTFKVYPNNLYAMLFAIKDMAPPEEFSSFLSQLEELLLEYRAIIDLTRLGMPYTWKIVLSC